MPIIIFVFTTGRVQISAISLLLSQTFRQRASWGSKSNSATRLGSRRARASDRPALFEPGHRGAGVEDRPGQKLAAPAGQLRSSVCSIWLESGSNRAAATSRSYQARRRTNEAADEFADGTRIADGRPRGDDPPEILGHQGRVDLLDHRQQDLARP